MRVVTFERINQQTEDDIVVITDDESTVSAPSSIPSLPPPALDPPRAVPTSGLSQQPGPIPPIPARGVPGARSEAPSKPTDMQCVVLLLAPSRGISLASLKELYPNKLEADDILQLVELTGLEASRSPSDPPAFVAFNIIACYAALLFVEVGWRGTFREALAAAMPTTPGTNPIPYFGLLELEAPVSIGRYVEWSQRPLECERESGYAS